VAALRGSFVAATNAAIQLPCQVQETRDLYGRMQADATEMGEQIVDKESQLDRLLTHGTIDEIELEKILKEIGQLQAKLRDIYLNSHLEQKNLLTKHQVVMYDKIRGYDSDTHGAHGSHRHSC
jgi:Spy/CpxP family protein refolding chaperone